VRRLVVAVALALVAALAGTPPAHAGRADGIVWLGGTYYAGVQMVTSYPTADDPYLHARFKRVGGEGQRQVRMGERHKKAHSHQWGRYRYQQPVKLAVGEKVVFTSEASLPCEPAVEPVGIIVDMRVKKPGQPWSTWETWISDDQRLLDCEEVLPQRSGLG
jgi:hypothetical protein